MYITETGFVKQSQKQITIQKDSWLKSIQKLLSLINPQQYYRGKPFSPGIQFYYYLTKVKQALSHLKVRLPDTILSTQNGYTLLQDNEGVMVKRQQNIKYGEFQSLIKASKSTQIRHFEKMIQEKRNKRLANNQFNDQYLQSILSYLNSQDCPDILTREREGHTFVKFNVSMRGPGFQMVSNNIMQQRFLKPAGLKANIFRVFYKSQFAKDRGDNYGFRLTNFQMIYRFDQKKRTFVNNKLYVDLGQKNSFEIVKIKGKPLQPFLAFASSLLEFLQKGLDVRITGAVLDFMIDIKKEIYLVNAKSFDFQQVGMVRQVVKDVQFLSCNIVCKLCGIAFRRKQASHLITYKLICQLAQHLKKRNLEIPGFNVSIKTTRPCVVCDLCYELVVSQHKLIDIQQKFAIMQNTPIKDCLNRVPRFISDNKPKKLYQWRLMIYLVQMQQNNMLQPASQYFFQFQFAQENSKFKLATHKPQKIPIMQVRVHYFFSDKINIEQFLQGQTLRFRLTRGQSWNDLCAQGQSKGLKNFKSCMEGQRQYNKIIVFFSNAKYLYVQSYLGLICDGLYDTQLLKLQQRDGIYFPQSDYFNCNPFPQQWMQVLVPQIHKRETAKMQQQEERAFRMMTGRSKFQQTTRPSQR